MEEVIETFIRQFIVSTIQYFVIAGISFLIFYIWFKNWSVKSKIQQRQAGRVEFVREILHSMQSLIIFALVGSLALVSPLKNHFHVYTDINEYSIWWVGVSFLLSFIIQDTYFYWMHRILHHKVIFKYAHLLHHKSTNPSPFTSNSFHFFEACVEGLVLVPILLFMPVYIGAILPFVITGFIINVYGHLGYEIAPRWLRNIILFEIITTSVHHNMHHSKFKGNYGLYFRFWDRIMKTEHPDYVRDYDRVQEMRFGKKEIG